MRPDGTFISASLTQVWPVSAGSRSAASIRSEDKTQNPQTNADQRDTRAPDESAKFFQRLPLIQSHLLIEFDQGAGRYVQKTIDDATQEVRNQFPREAQLAFSRTVRAEANKLINIEF